VSDVHAELELKQSRSRKAQHLGISQQDVEERLRRGDATLMSWLLTTTLAAYQAYRQWQSSQGQTGSSSNGKSQPSSGGGETAPDAL
jgi:hypothetical protein